VASIVATRSLAQSTDPVANEFFESRIRPVLVAHCYECHSADAGKLKGSLRVDGPDHLRNGGDSGPAIVPGEPDASLLIKAVRYRDEDTAMPPKQRLSDTQVADLETWVRLGAPWPEDTSPKGPTAAAAGGYDWAALRASHWAFRPMLKSEPPPVRETRWARSPLDRFILARLEAAGLRPAPPAERRLLLRRAYLDLTGLPPAPEEVDAFVQDPDPDAFARVVDRLLASPRYGERWARHWLDVARYSDGLGGFLDAEPLPEAWRYRDWVVDALNRDVPYNEFVRAQIAGDLESNDPSAGVATGFFAVGPTYISDGGDPEAQAQARAETLADRVDTFSRAFLGLTVACARCHDHKFDPITARDYYALAGIFNNTSTGLRPAAAPDVVAASNAWQHSVQTLEKSLAEAGADESARGRLPELRESLNRLRQTAPPAYPSAHQLAESGNSDLPVAIRGDLRKPGEPAPRRFLQIIAGEQAPVFQDGSGRRQLAEAVTEPGNPLTARVLVNRVWKHHFGEALVRTPSNFGLLGEAPTHPELLDWLAVTFIENGWSLKNLHRLILLSSAWQMSSRHDEAAFAQDGGNRLLWRMNPRRLEVEAWRDSLLAVTGELDPSLGGSPIPSVFDGTRRTLYATISRNGDRDASDEFLRLFDFPTPRSTSESRAVSTVPQQYLFMLNSGFMLARAKALAARLAVAAASDRDRIDHAYRRLYARPPTETETRLGLDFLGTATAGGTPAWESYAQALLAAHEFRQVQ
jgi:mono/diheme cytochrome c family protein